ncbi:MAG: hypothetical protein ABEH40_06050 [Haloferacaceae archaeon]
MFDATSLLRGPAGWLLVALVANLSVVLVAAALLVLGTRTGGDAGGDPPGDAADGRDAAGDGRVECPSCRTTNGAEYRFCRECLDELPGRSGVGAAGSGPRRRPMP